MTLIPHNCIILNIVSYILTYLNKYLKSLIECNILVQVQWYIHLGNTENWMRHYHYFDTIVDIFLYKNTFFNTIPTISLIFGIECRGVWVVIIINILIPPTAHPVYYYESNVFFRVLRTITTSMNVLNVLMDKYRTTSSCSLLQNGCV